jgi:signal transduction histidine kinase
VRSIDPASDCSWFTPETADAVGSKTVVVVADGVRGVLGLRIPAAPLTAQTATARSLVFGGGGALFLVLAGLLVYSAKHQDITIATTTVLLEALAGGDLSARASEVGTAEERRALAAGNAVAERLQVTVERQRTFLADAAHQLRNPLLALQLRLENLEPYVLAKGRRGYSRLTQDVERLGTTLDDLVAFARATETDGEPREVDVLAVVDERLRAWVSVAHSRKIVLRQRLPRVAVALARPGALEQALDVLVDNALKHAPQRSEVTVVVVPTATYVEVRVEDRGRGLPAGAQAAAAVRGWRRDPRAAGSGLGLAIATLLLSSSGGSLQLGDRLDGPGLSATLRLPTPAPTVDDELLPAWTQGSQGSAGWRED